MSPPDDRTGPPKGTGPKSTAKTTASSIDQAGDAKLCTGPMSFTVTARDDERLTVTVWGNENGDVHLRLDVYMDPDSDDAWPQLELAADAAHALGVVLMMASKRHLRAIVDCGDRTPGEVGIAEVQHERRCPAATSKLVKACRRWQR